MKVYRIYTYVCVRMCVKKSKLKSYLTWEKWRMNEMFIFFKIPVALKKIIESKDVFNKREVNEMFIFFQVYFLDVQDTYSSKFSFAWSISKTPPFIWDEAAVLYFILKSRWQHRFPWLSLTIRPYQSLLSLGHLNYILCPHSADVNKLLLVGQHWHVHV